MHALRLPLLRADAPGRTRRAALHETAPRPWRPLLLSAALHVLLFALASYVVAPWRARPGLPAGRADAAGPALSVRAPEPAAPYAGDPVRRDEDVAPAELPVMELAAVPLPEPAPPEPLPEPDAPPLFDETSEPQAEPTAALPELPSAPRDPEARIPRKPASAAPSTSPLSVSLRAADPPAAAPPVAAPRSRSHGAPALGDGVLVPPSPWPSNRQPVFPAEALARREGGAVLLRLEVSLEGTVTSVAVERSSGSDLLDRAASDAAWSWRFRPALRGGRPIAAIVRRAVRFTA